MVYSENSDKEVDLDELAEKLKDKELVFAHAYVRLLSKSKAAVEAGFPAESGCKVYNKPHVNAYIKALLKLSIADSESNIRLIQTMADGNVTDYFVPVQVVKRDLIRKSLAEIIKDREIELLIESEFFTDYVKTPIQGTLCRDRINSLQQEIARYKLKLKYYPDAYEMVYGPEYLVITQELDLNLLAADKEHGRIKTFVSNKDGVRVEMYNAQEAANTLAKIHGSFEKDNSQSRPVINNLLTKERIKEISDKLDNEV